MLKGIRVKNFKCFEDIEVNNLSEISLFTGVNNVGKSTLIQAIIFLRQSIINNRFDWNNNEIQLRSFQDTIYKHELERNIEISCSFSLTEKEIKRLNYPDANLKILEYSVTFNKDNKILKEVVSNEQSKEFIVLEHTIVKDRHEISPVYHDIKLLNTNAVVSLGTKLEFRSSSDTAPLQWEFFNRDETNFIVKFCNSIKDILYDRFINFTYYLSPERPMSTWDSDVTSDTPDVGSKGQNTTKKLHYIYSDRLDVFNTIEKWLIKFDNEIKMLRSPMKNGRVIIELRTLLTDVNIMTMGHGIHTAIPIISQCLLAPKGSTIIIEEPEIHLHPAAQEVLIDLFYEMTKENKQIIFTTHSMDILTDIYQKIQTHTMVSEKICNKHIKRFDDGARTCDDEPLFEENFQKWKKRKDDLRKKPS